MSFNDLHHAAQAPLSEIVVIDWHPCLKNTLQGFAKIKVPAWGLTIDGVGIHKKDDRAWVQLPARPQIDKEGNVLREDDGKIRYAKVLEIDDKRAAWDFGDRVVEAVRRKVAAR
jgi:hypothetical protein